MKIFQKFLMFIGFFVVSFLGACNTADLPSAKDFKIHRDVLDNGLVVLAIEDHSVPIVSYSTWYRVGSAWEKLGATGIAHLFEHLMFKGTPRYSGKMFFQNLESKGATVNAYTQRDATVYYEIIASQHLDMVMDMEADRMANLMLTQEQLDSERQVVKEERRLRVDSQFSAQQSEELQSLIFPTHPYGWPVIGYQDDLDSLTLEQCRQFFKTYYQPANAVVTIAGDFDYPDVLRSMKKYYGPIAGKHLPPLELEDEPKAAGEKRKTILRPVEAESILIGYRIPEMKNKDIPALSMLSWALFGMASSRAHERLVREKQVALNIGAQVDLGKFPSVFYISAELKMGFPAEKALQEIDALIAEAKLEALTEEELGRVKNRLMYSVVNETKSPFGIASWLTHGEYYFGDYKKVFDLLKAYDKTTVADLMRVARVYLRPENRAVVLMKPSAQGRHK